MRAVAVALCSTGVLGGLAFCVDYAWAVLRRRPTMSPRTRTARDILISASGITVLVASFLTYALIGADVNGWVWVLFWQVGLLSTAMFPVWLAKRRQALRAGASMETWPFP